MKRLNELLTDIENRNMVSFQEIYPYRKSLYLLLKDYFCEEPVFMITLLTNAIQAGKIVPANEFNDELLDEVNKDNEEFAILEEEMDEDTFMEFETINFNSQFLKDVLD